MYYFILAWADRNGVKLDTAIYKVVNENFCYKIGRSNFIQNYKNIKVVVNQKVTIFCHYKRSTGLKGKEKYDSIMY